MNCVEVCKVAYFVCIDIFIHYINQFFQDSDGSDSGKQNSRPSKRNRRKQLSEFFNPAPSLFPFSLCLGIHSHVILCCCVSKSLFLGLKNGILQKIPFPIVRRKVTKVKEVLLETTDRLDLKERNQQNPKHQRKKLNQREVDVIPLQRIMTPKVKMKNRQHCGKQGKKSGNYQVLNN